MDDGREYLTVAKSSVIRPFDCYLKQITFLRFCCFSFQKFTSTYSYGLTDIDRSSSSSGRLSILNLIPLNLCAETTRFNCLSVQYNVLSNNVNECGCNK